MDADTLVRAVRAALDDRERLALAAGERSRNWRAIGSGAVEHDGKSPFPVVYDEGYPTEAEADHIAANDPAAVLRLVKYDREIVDWCAEVVGSTDLSLYGQFGSLRQHPEPLAVTLAVETLRALAHGLGIDTEETP